MNKSDNEFLVNLRELLEKHDITIELTTGLDDTDGEVKPLITFTKKISNTKWVEIFGSFKDIYPCDLP